MKNAEPFRIDDDDERPVPQVAVHGPRHGLHPFGDLARLVAALESQEGPPDSCVGMSGRRIVHRHRPGAGRIEQRGPRRSKRMRRPASKRKSSPEASRSRIRSRSRPVMGGRPGRAKGEARRAMASRWSSAGSREKRGVTATPSGPARTTAADADS